MNSDDPPRFFILKKENLTSAERQKYPEETGDRRTFMGVLPER
jgi:hypothetical protein